MDSIEESLKQILDGKAVTNDNASYCDFTIQSQIEELGLELSIQNFCFTFLFFSSKGS